MNRFFVSILFCFFTVVPSSCTSANKTVESIPRFEPGQNEADFPVQVPKSFNSTVGWLIVKENKDDFSSPTIKLPVAIVHAREKSNKSPVVYLSGGPGTSALSTAAYPGAYPWTQERDFIVFGQRGTHFAEPALMCPEYGSIAKKNGDVYRAIRDCRSRLIEKNIDLSNYNSLQSAEDIEDLRKVLGLDEINLYGGSYGTRLALTYARLYPNNIRSMLLDSPLPPNAIYDDESVLNFERALKAVAQDCMRQEECRSAFPELEARFFASLSEGFEEASISQVVSKIDLTSLGGIHYAPLIMNTIARRDPTLFEDSKSSNEVSDFAWGMRLSVWCSEAWPFSERSQSVEPKAILGGFESAAIDPKFCEIWDVPTVDRNFISPVNSNIPTMIIVGEFDPLTPPKWAHLAAKTLENSKVVIINREGHTPTQNWGGDGCAMKIASQFISEPEQTLSANEESLCAFKSEGPDYVTNLP